MSDHPLPKKNLIHELDPSKKKIVSEGVKKQNFKSLLFTIIIMLILGVGSGYVASNVSGTPKKGPTSISGDATSGEIKKGFTAGVEDTSAFPDTAEGVVREGGIDGEGEYHLERPGGESQNVYMTSSAVDLSQFIGKTIKVWGQTQTAQTAGWLMDVGKVEVK